MFPCPLRLSGSGGLLYLIPMSGRESVGVEAYLVPMLPETQDVGHALQAHDEALLREVTLGQEVLVDVILKAPSGPWPHGHVTLRWSGPPK